MVRWVVVRGWVTGPPAEKLGLLPAAQEHVLKQESGKERTIRAVRELSQAFALSVPRDEALRIRDEVGFFQAAQAVLAKRAPVDARPEEDLDLAVRQIIARAVAPEGVIDIFAAAGLAKPDISILSDEFLAEVRGMPQRNLAVELLPGELAVRRRKNVVQAGSFAEMLERTLRKYQNRAIEAAQFIEELIGLARDHPRDHGPQLEARQGRSGADVDAGAIEQVGSGVSPGPPFFRRLEHPLVAVDRRPQEPEPVAAGDALARQRRVGAGDAAVRRQRTACPQRLVDHRRDEVGLVPQVPQQGCVGGQRVQDYADAGRDGAQFADRPVPSRRRRRLAGRRRRAGGRAHDGTRPGSRPPGAGARYDRAMGRSPRRSVRTTAGGSA